VVSHCFAEDFEHIWISLLEPQPERIAHHFTSVDRLLVVIDIELATERFPDCCPLLGIVIERTDERRDWPIPDADRLLLVTCVDAGEFVTDRRGRFLAFIVVRIRIEAVTPGSSSVSVPPSLCPRRLRA
jgi:hypothetical protein